MEQVRFGRTGLRVSRLCLGTMTFGLQCDVAQGHAILDAAAAGGVNFLDTADVYPLAGGLLTGRHNAEAPPAEGSRFQLGTAGARYQERYWHRREFETIEALRPIAAEAGMSKATMAMRWVMSNPAITAPIIGASKPERLADSFAAAEKGSLPRDLKEKLDDVSREWRAVDAER